MVSVIFKSLYYTIDAILTPQKIDMCTFTTTMRTGIAHLLNLMKRRMRVTAMNHETASGDTVKIGASSTNKLVRCQQTGRCVWLALGVSPAMEICPVCGNPKGKQPGQCDFKIESE